MIRAASKTAVLAVLAGCAQTATTTAPSISLTQGTYDVQFDSGCGTMEVGPDLSYVFDGGCDGSVDYEAASVSISGAQILVDQAVVNVRAVGPDSFSGVWQVGGDSANVLFRRRL